MGSSVFTEGFAWECLEVYSGPPKCVFKWRHFGKYTGTYEDAEGNKYKGDGRMFSLYGTVVATLNADAKIQELEVFYNPDDKIVPSCKSQRVPYLLWFSHMSSPVSLALCLSAK